ncbi:MAG: hypothetical protein ACI4TX_02570, partial [Christensenellales bacterium]
MIDLGVSSVLVAGIADAVLNVLAIIGIVCLGAFIIVFICDLILSISGNKNGIFFKKKETIYEEEPKQEQNYNMEKVENLSLYDERLSAIEERQNSIDMQKAEEEERALREKLAFDRQYEIENVSDKEREQDERLSDLEAKNEELLRLLEEKDDDDIQTEEVESVSQNSFLEDVEDEEDDYDDIIAAINKMREEEDAIVDEDDYIEEETVVENDETVIDNNDNDSDGEEVQEEVLFEDLSATEDDVVQPTVEEVASASDIKDDEYYKTLSQEIAELKKELEEQKRIMEQDKIEAQEREETLRKENELLAEELEDAKQVQEEVAEVSPILLTEQEYNNRLEMLKERLKENEKQLRKIKKEFKPLERVAKTLERDKEKLRRREAIVAKQKIVLYGVNNYIDIDEEKAQKLAEDLDLLDGLRLSVQHCEEVMEANKDRYPILEQTYNILVNNSEQINADIKQLEEDLAKLKANADNGDDDAHQEVVALMDDENVEDVVLED